MSDSVRPHRWQPSRVPRPWDSPGKNTGVGCHFLLQCMKLKSERKSLSRIQLLVTPWTAAYQAPPSKGFSRQEYWSGLPLPSLIYMLLLLLLSRSSRVRLWQPHRWQPTRLPRPWDSPGKSTGVGCHYRLYLAAAAAAAAAANWLQSCPTLCDPIGGSPAGSPVPGMLQAGALAWGEHEGH